jgi:NAD(P)-dependent dehydrogenase (short-subunit alcohol dehydrogenase family)
MSIDSSETREQTKPTREARGGRFTGKVALVTGTSDRGIGGAIAEMFAREGGAVMLVSRAAPKRLIKRLDRMGAEYLWRDTDITKRDEVRRLFDDCMEELSQIDIVVNNAGVGARVPLEEFEDDQWRQMIDVNLTGAIEVSRTALPLLPQGGVIVNVSSALALGGCWGYSVYSATKAGMNAFTQSLAWEVAPRGIRVVGVAPGLVDTPMIHNHIGLLTDSAWSQIKACHPLGVGSPHDVANAIEFLASREASWITGVTLPLGWAPGYPLPIERPPAE